MASITRVEELPPTITKKGAPPLWQAMVAAYKEGYEGWLKTSVPTEKEAVRLNANLRYYAKQLPDTVKLEFRRRRTADGTYDVYGRLTKRDGTESLEA